jgi:2-polyprenyl-3-methyl-5-hydroxy-6-metoxy-1,4-benzoquinol methylase
MTDDYRTTLQPYADYGSADVGPAAYQAAIVRVDAEYEAAYGPYLPSDRQAKILDIGCGQGLCIAWLRRRGYTQVAGIDQSPTMLAVAKTHLGEGGLQQIDDLAKWLSSHEESYDAIVLNQVIEHFTKQEIAVYLPLIRKALRPGGVFLVQTPNACAFDGMRSRYVDITHEVGFTENSLAQVLHLAGFVDIRMIAARPPLRGGPRRLLFRLLQRWQQVWLGWQYLIALGSDRPRVLTPNLTGIATRPTVSASAR